MVHTNPHFSRLNRPYLFPVIEKKVAAFRSAHPDTPLLNLGIGDISLPLVPAIGEGICQAVEEMMAKAIGYGPSEGYDFLRSAICSEEYGAYGFTSEEIFISDGTNTDVTSLYELFEEKATVIIIDPTYPAYLDAAYLSGKEVILLPASETQGFIPSPPCHGADLAILCTPSNPTGVAFSYEDLKPWIAWALQHRAILIIDNVYQPFITSEEIPRSIYTLEGAAHVAIELRSFSKWAGFTGLRCGYMMIPKKLHTNLHTLWSKRINIKSNGVSYPIQRGALAAFSNEGKKQLKAQLHLYQSSAHILRNALCAMGETFFGGVDAPYIFWKCPKEISSSWEMVEFLLEKAHLLAIPGVGFGSYGEGFVRLSCFITPQLAQEASDALQHLYRAT